MIMTKIRSMSSGGCNEELVEGFGGGGVAQGAAGAGVELGGDGVEAGLGVDRDKSAGGSRSGRKRPTHGSVVVDAAGGVGEGVAGTAPAQLDELRRDGHRRLLRG